jgi:hypothetical protein
MLQSIIASIHARDAGSCFNGKFRDECLNMEVFYSLAEAATIVESWRHYYNHERPHSSLRYRTPAEFAAAWRLVSGTLEPSPQHNEITMGANRVLSMEDLTCPPKSAPLGVLESQRNQEVLRETGAVFGGRDRWHPAGRREG